MKYLKTKHERNSAKITTLIVLILVLLIFVVGPQYMDPPEEYGVAVNFGTTDFGKGNIQPKELIKAQPKEVIEEPKVEETKQETTKADPKTEDVLTNESPESIAIKKQKAAEAKAKANAERVEREKRKEEEEKKKKLDALIGGVSNSDGKDTGSEGNDNQAGDKGQLNGDPYAPSYFDGSGPGRGGVGFGLGGRGRPSKKAIKQDCNEEGRVVVKITVNRSGKVIKAEPGVRGTTNNASCLLIPAKKTALSYKWPSDSKAPNKQIGFIVIDFSLSQ